MSPRSPAQTEASRANGQRSRGPVTEAGRARASLNRLRHGLDARGLLFKGESPAAYQRQLDALSAHLQPRTRADAEVVAQLADLMFKLHRLDSIEQGMRRRNLEESVKKSATYANLVKTLNARRGLSAMISTIDSTAHMEIKAGELADFMSASRSVMMMLYELPDLPPNQVLEMARELQALDDSADGETVVNFTRLREATGVVSTALDVLVKRRKGAVARHRRQLAASSLLLNDSEVRLLERYRRTLDNSISRTLAILETFRHQAPTDTGSGSFGQKMRVNLKLVR